MVDISFPFKASRYVLTMNHEFKFALEKVIILNLFYVQKIVSTLIICDQIHRLPTFTIKRLVLRAVRGVEIYVRVCLYPIFLIIGVEINDKV